MSSSFLPGRHTVPFLVFVLYGFVRCFSCIFSHAFVIYSHLLIFVSIPGILLWLLYSFQFFFTIRILGIVYDILEIKMHKFVYFMLLRLGYLFLSNICFIWGCYCAYNFLEDFQFTAVIMPVFRLN
jgi:hypothetical protein